MSAVAVYLTFINRVIYIVFMANSRDVNTASALQQSGYSI